MTVRGLPAPSSYLPNAYWEDRAQLFAAEGEGLAAVCSYGMPEFYNRMIHRCQWLALKPWIDVTPGSAVLDIGCGVGRWSLLLAERGARVTGVDLSPTMISEANRRAKAADRDGACTFTVQDLAHLNVRGDGNGKFDLILGVTVLQHILDPQALQSAVQRMSEHLAPGGRMVLLEAAPAKLACHCNTTVFQARQRDTYLALFRQTGLDVQAITGVDPAPFKTWLLPYMRRLPKPLALAMLVLVTALSVPVDFIFGRRAVNRSWHALFVLKPAAGGDHVE